MQPLLRMQGIDKSFAGVAALTSAELEIAPGVAAATENADAFDAMLCVLAGQDFLSGRAMPPDNLELARQEGWIWVRRPAEMRPD